MTAIKSKHFEYLKNLLSAKIPAYIVLILCAMTAMGCSYFLEKPSMDAVPTITSLTKRIVERSKENEDSLRVLRSNLNAVAQVSDDERIHRLNRDLEEYVSNRENMVSNLYKYLELSLDEYESIYKVYYGNLPEDYQKIIDDARKSIRESSSEGG